MRNGGSILGVFCLVGPMVLKRMFHWIKECACFGIEKPSERRNLSLMKVEAISLVDSRSFICETNCLEKCQMFFISFSEQNLYA